LTVIRQGQWKRKNAKVTSDHSEIYTVEIASPAGS
jgi:hypothetical protein